MAARPIPDGYHTVTPYLTVRDAAKVIDFLKQAFGAELSHEPIKRPDGKIMHAEVKIGNSRVMIAEESEMGKATLVVALSLFSERRQRVPAGRQGRRQDDHGTDGHVLRRPLRRREGSVGQQLDDRHAQGRRRAAGAGEARRGLLQAAEAQGGLGEPFRFPSGRAASSGRRPARGPAQKGATSGMPMKVESGALLVRV